MISVHFRTMGFKKLFISCDTQLSTHFKNLNKKKSTTIQNSKEIQDYKIWNLL